jgi:hypothetical protein
MMLVVICLVPESPRWLLMQNKVEKAREIVMKLHSIKGEPDQEFARSEFYQMHKQAEMVCSSLRPILFATSLTTVYRIGLLNQDG